MQTLSTHKLCTKCRSVKECTEFTVAKANRDGLHRWCRECTRESQRKNRDCNYNKNSFLKSTYGITLEEFDTMVERQKGVCAICKKPETRKSRYGGTCRLHVDHDHSSGKVRGLLCSGCNSAIGHMKEDVKVLTAAIHYLNNNT